MPDSGPDTPLGARKMLTGRHAAPAAASILATFALSACSHLHWPWKHHAPPAPASVNEVVVSSPGGGAAVEVPQYWKRNTLVLDLHALSGSGSILVQRRPNTTWPVRLALRVMPGSVGQVEVRAAQRMVLPVTTQGAKPVDLELPPGVYTAQTPEITITWGPAGL
jgi:hypothetical protein